MRISMTGGRGCVGRYLSRLGVHDLGCDVTNPLEIQKAIKYSKPDMVIHLASKSNVDWCQKEENERIVTDVNLWGMYHVAEQVKKVGARMILMSSDHLFDGGWWGGSYKENSKAKPLNTYGMSKFCAEALTSMYDEVKIVRTSFLFDYERLENHISRIKSGDAEYPAFIKRSFMYLPHFANSLMEYIRRFDDMPKTLHISGCETSSWYEFACSLAREYGYRETNVVPRKKEIEGFAPRGHNLGLSTSLSRKLGFEQWDYLQGIRQMRLDNG
jgi:dTDP-4-dehydrorhamnose reductase